MVVNGILPGILAKEAATCGAALIHYSTDYVFDGKKKTPYVEDDELNPLNVYGKTKLVGERAIQQIDVPRLIFRTSWVYSTRGKNFLLTILRLAKIREELKVVDDQIGAPTWSRMIAEATAQIIVQCYLTSACHASSITSVSGLYHLTAAGKTSLYSFAKAVLDHSTKLNAESSPFILQTSRLLPIPTHEYPTPTQRPAYSMLDNNKVSQMFALKLPDWNVQLGLALNA